MIKKSDTHLHGNFSSDSTIRYYELCRKAVKHGYQYLAITEHFDLLESELMNFGLLSLREYFHAIKELKEDYPQLMIMTGLEIGEPHRNQETLYRLLSHFKPEFIIGSLHVTRTKINVSLPIYKPLSALDITLYYEENLEMVDRGGFDVLGHLGVYKRGLQPGITVDETHAFRIMDEIFRLMIKKDIALEVNNSSMKTAYQNIVPDPTILQRYKNLGGELVCIGSDSHDIDHFDKFYNKTLDILSNIGFSSFCVKLDNEWKLCPFNK
jgi:histidinol-phosphatase (PHP family)